RGRGDGELPAGGEPPGLRGGRPHAGLEDDRGPVPGVREGDRGLGRQGGEPRTRAAGDRHPPREPPVVGAEPRGQAVAQPRPPRPGRVVARPRRGPRVARGRVQGRLGRDRLQRPVPPGFPGGGGNGGGADGAEGPREPGDLPPPGRGGDGLPLRRDADAAVEGRRVWVERMEVRDVRNVREASLELSPGLNVLVGRNAQGKTSLLEAVGLLARGRSFRTEQTETLIRRGAGTLRAQGVAVAEDRRTCLEVELAPGERRLLVDGREVSPREYHG